ncbi:MAG: hypothetical protein OEM18_04925 [Nitrosopumilus sp.]|nr:hypothetical protein [Nitrosopumilus sp.]MDH3502122.1 hypothetical protein [Nitrosopumilus sp.]
MEDHYEFGFVVRDIPVQTNSGFKGMSPFKGFIIITTFGARYDLLKTWVSVL